MRIASKLGDFAGRHLRGKTLAPLLGGLVIILAIAATMLRTTQAAESLAIAAPALIAAVALAAIASQMWTKRREVVTKLKSLAVAIGWLVVLGVIVAAVTVTYTFMDSSGWMSHTAITTITAQSTWMVGETRRCASIGKSAFLDVQCDDGPNRSIRVTFFGRENQPEYSVVHWNCTRDASSFTCVELSGDAVLPQ